jgi:hypothetical protein
MACMTSTCAFKGTDSKACGKVRRTVLGRAISSISSINRHLLGPGTISNALFMDSLVSYMDCIWRGLDRSLGRLPGHGPTWSYYAPLTMA